MKSPVTKLWSYNSITGCWCYERTCFVNEAERWLDVFRRTEPAIAFRLSKPRPHTKPRHGERECERDA